MHSVFVMNKTRNSIPNCQRRHRTPRCPVSSLAVWRIVPSGVMPKTSRGESCWMKIRTSRNRPAGRRDIDQPSRYPGCKGGICRSIPFLMHDVGYSNHPMNRLDNNWLDHDAYSLGIQVPSQKVIGVPTYSYTAKMAWGFIHFGLHVAPHGRHQHHSSCS